MKKLLAAAALGTMLVAGFFVAQDNPVDIAMEVEPTVLSIGKDVTLF
ncbi:hypothetical protein SAMN05216238_11188 [Lentibacillus persicus]|uniref:Uncharacterized protein n=1 Tax=Lentibacillus persicus TaxID=640948 RepID=A0A1I1Z3C1_9BACI|nr:hypothetical protein [Lentibacillus persicus]SFE26344.1 hypothetical protein SAMN05216238_11188 [Lentibacillus persicus]